MRVYTLVTIEERWIEFVHIEIHFVTERSLNRKKGRHGRAVRKP